MSRPVVLIVILTVLLGFTANVQAQSDQAGASYLGAPKGDYQVYFFGDAMAGGIWAGTTRMSKGNPRIAPKARYKEGSGLARPQFYDWVEALPPIVERNQVDIAVVMMGVNDGRTITVSGDQLPVGSSQWREYYVRRVDSVLDVLRSLKVPVYWIELPPMADPARDEVIRLISSIHRERAQAAGVRFLDIRKAFLTDDGTYTDSGEGVDGRFQRLRSRDGIQFLKSGNNKVASLLLDLIEKDIAVADGVLEPDPLDTVAEQAPSPQDNLKPIFGQSLPESGVATIEPRDLPRLDAVAIARPQTIGADGVGSNGAAEASSPQQKVELLSSNTAPGSAAERLFKTGEWTSQPGRFDDFSYKPQ